MKPNYLKFIDVFINEFSDKLKVDDLEAVLDEFVDGFVSLRQQRTADLFYYLVMSGLSAIRYFILDNLEVDIFKGFESKIKKFDERDLYKISPLPEKTVFDLRKVNKTSSDIWPLTLTGSNVDKNKLIYSPEEFQLFWPDIILPKSRHGNTILNANFITVECEPAIIPVSDFTITLPEDIQAIDPSLFEELESLNTTNVYLLFKPTSDGKLPFKIAQKDFELARKYLRPY